jgi:hypothetical protein
MPVDDHSGKPTRIDRFFFAPLPASTFLLEDCSKTPAEQQHPRLGASSEELSVPSNQVLVPSTLRLLGTELGTPEHRPSDHFGLAGDFKIALEPQANRSTGRISPVALTPLERRKFLS